jgi:hypothetical protein
MNTTTTPKLTKAGAQLMTIIGRRETSFFDGGIVANEGIWHECLTGETAGAEGMPSSAKGVANVITKLAADGYLELHDNSEDGVWVVLTDLGADTANELAAEKAPAAKETAKAAKAPAAKKVTTAKATTKKTTAKKVADKAPAKATGLELAKANLEAAKKSGQPVNAVGIPTAAMTVAFARAIGEDPAKVWAEVASYELAVALKG